MALGPPGIVFVGSRNEGKVHAVVDRDRDHRADEVHVLASDLERPSGVAFRDGHLYVAAVSRILRLRDVMRDLRRPPVPEVVTDRYPSEERHGWKFIAFGPDGRLYVPVGAPCNVCEPPGPLHATITRLDLGGGEPEVVARRVRNTVGFDFHPVTGELWFTDNGRDHLGDDQPPDELDRLTKPGEHFGFPYCHGAGLRDPDYNNGRPCDQFVPPVGLLDPHVAALGMRFYTGQMSRKRTGVGSSSPSMARGIGPRRSGTASPSSRWRTGARRPTRPSRRAGSRAASPAADRPTSLVMPDGSLLVSDDKAGRIYRITYAPGA